MHPSLNCSLCMHAAQEALQFVGGNQVMPAQRVQSLSGRCAQQEPDSSALQSWILVLPINDTSTAAFIHALRRQEVTAYLAQLFGMHSMCKECKNFLRHLSRYGHLWLPV